MNVIEAKGRTFDLLNAAFDPDGHNFSGAIRLALSATGRLNIVLEYHDEKDELRQPLIVLEDGEKDRFLREVFSLVRGTVDAQFDASYPQPPDATLLP